MQLSPWFMVTYKGSGLPRVLVISLPYMSTFSTISVKPGLKGNGSTFDLVLRRFVGPSLYPGLNYIITRSHSYRERTQNTRTIEEADGSVRLNINRIASLVNKNQKYYKGKEDEALPPDPTTSPPLHDDLYLAR